MRSLIFAFAALALATSAAATPNCTKGVPCGNACIAKGKTCHVATSAASAGVAAAASTGAAAAAAPAKAPPTCKAGKTKLCGKACIPVAKTCSK